MLHFSARWGLDKLTIQLLECPGGELAISLRNVNGRTPLELAEQYQHGKCVEILKNFSVSCSSLVNIKLSSSSSPPRLFVHAGNAQNCGDNL